MKQCPAGFSKVSKQLHLPPTRSEPIEKSDIGDLQMENEIHSLAEKAD